MEREGKRRGVRHAKVAIAMLTLEELAYIAELVDGNGAIYIATLGRGHWRNLHPVVTVAAAEREVIDWLVKRTDSGATTLDTPTSLCVQPAFRFRAIGERAMLLCEALRPYLQVRAEQARLIASFPMGRQDANHIDDMSDQQRLR